MFAVDFLLKEIREKEEIKSTLHGLLQKKRPFIKKKKTSLRLAQTRKLAMIKNVNEKYKEDAVIIKMYFIRMKNVV